MNKIANTLFLLCALLVFLKTSIGQRVRRQTPLQRPAVFRPRFGDYNLPPFYQPMPGRDASSLSPLFPFTSQFSNGLDINTGTRATVDGNLNVPLFGWGGIKFGHPNIRVGSGYMSRPDNPLDISPLALDVLAQNHLFNYARETVPSIPVAVLPGNFVPLRCKPPMCNPFIEMLGFGVDVEPGDDFLVDGGLDFPIPLAAGGIGVRVPFSGGVNIGTDPVLISYAQNRAPVDDRPCQNDNCV